MEGYRQTEERAFGNESLPPRIDPSDHRAVFLLRIPPIENGRVFGRFLSEKVIKFCRIDSKLPNDGRRTSVIRTRITTKKEYGHKQRQSYYR